MTNLIRLFRKRAGFSQPELAHLLGLAQSTVSELESDAELPSLESALGLQIVLDAEPSLIFVSLYERLEAAIMSRAAELDAALRGRTDAAALGKLRSLADMARRASPNRREA